MKKKLIVVALATIVAIGACWGGGSFSAEPQISDIQRANIEALESPSYWQEGVSGICSGYSVVYCRATCTLCGSVYEASIGGPASEVGGICIICGNDKFFPW